MSDLPEKEPLPDRLPRDAGNWAQTGPRLKVDQAHAPKGANRRPVDGRQLVGPLQGFGPMWQKTYKVRLEDCQHSPAFVIKTWKENFPRFWPKGNRFFAPLTGITPGEVALISSSAPGGFKLSTGVLVLYADEESFTLMTPLGHVFAGWVTFSAYQDREAGNTTVVQAQVLMRSPDPIIEVGLRLGAHKVEDRFWESTLRSLSNYLGVDTVVQTKVICVDPKIQWSQARNIRYNAMMNSTFDMMLAPARFLLRRRS